MTLENIEDLNRRVIKDIFEKSFLKLYLQKD